MAPRKPTPARATRKSVLKSILQTVSSLGRVTKSKPPPRPASPSHTTSTTISITKAPLRILLTSITRKYWNLGRVTKSKPLSRLASPSYTYSTSKLTSITVAPLRRVLTSIIRTYSNPGRATRTKSPPHPVKEPSDAYRMRLYDNGLLNLENTPPHLIAAVERNAKSPLLSLPPEIRNRIWSLACGGHLVTVLNQCDGKGKTLVKAGAICDTFDSTITLQQYDFMQMVDYCWPQSILLAFRLPEVCRQIYSEAALTSYKENIFRLYDSGCLSKLLGLITAQRNAITALEASPGFLADLVESYDGPIYLEFEDDIDLFKKLMVKDFTVDTVSGGLPNFRKFVVTDLAMRNARRCYEGDWEWENEGEEIIETEEQLKAWVLDHFSALTDAGVEIVFGG